MLVLIESRLCLRLLRQRSLLKQRQLPSLSHRTLDGYNMLQYALKLYIYNLHWIHIYMIMIFHVLKCVQYIYIYVCVHMQWRYPILSPKIVPCIIILYHAFQLPWRQRVWDRNMVDPSRLWSHTLSSGLFTQAVCHFPLLYLAVPGSWGSPKCDSYFYIAHIQNL